MISAMHVVIAGSPPEADRLARSFSESGRAVVRLEDSRSSLSFDSAELERAEYFLSVCASDEESLAAGEAAQDRGAPFLQVFVRITDRDLYARLSPRWFESTAGARLDVFDPSDVAARLLLEQHPVRDADMVAIVGSSPLTEALVRQAIRDRY